MAEDDKTNDTDAGDVAQAAAPLDVKSALELAANTARSREQALPIGQMLGEMVWLLAQSPTHKRFALEDLHWYLIPPLRFSQCRLFFGTPDATEARPNPVQMPCGLATWAFLSKEAETRFIEMVKSGKPVRLKPNDWNSGQRLWMIDIVAPFATPQNQQIQTMMTDLLQNGLLGAYPKAKDHMVRFFQQDTKTGERKIMEVKAELRAAQPANP